MAMLKKLLGVKSFNKYYGSFGSSLGHLTIFLGGLGFPQWFDLLAPPSWDVGV